MSEVKTLADIAQIAGVTTATVSRALSGYQRVSPSTRRKVLDIAERHGFQVNQTARNLRLGRTKAVGVVIPLGHESAQRVSDPFYTALIGHLMEGLARREHAMLLSAETPHDTMWLSNLSRSGRVDGVIVLCQSDQDPVLRDVGRSYRPMVVWGEAAGDAYCCIGTDNREGGRIATEHLLAQGRRRIAFAGMTDIPELSARYQGYCDAHAAAGLEPGPRIPVPLAFDPDTSVVREAIAGVDSVDAVFGASDMIAMGVMRVLIEQGRRVPEDVAVVGYDDVSLAAHASPGLTTIRQDLRVAAELMLDALFARMDGEAVPSAHVPLQLVRRQSA